MSAYNAYCCKCRKDYIVENEKDKCPVCKGKIKILGIKLRVTASNGEFNKHI